MPHGILEVFDALGGEVTHSVEYAREAVVSVLFHTMVMASAVTIVTGVNFGSAGLVIVGLILAIPTTVRRSTD